MSDYIEDVINDKITEIKEKKNLYDTGRVMRIVDYIVEVRGLENVFFFEEVHIGNKAVGYVSKINDSSVIVSIVKQFDDIFINDEVRSSKKMFQMNFSPKSIGHVIDLFGIDKTTGKKFDDCFKLDIDNPTIPIMERRAVNRPLYTGVSGIDLLYPIGKGQRQLVIGDKKTGKTQLCLDAINNQNGKDVLCIYIAIGKTKKNIKDIYNQLAKKGALSYTIILTADNDEKAPVLSLTPYAGLSIAEKCMKEGMDVLVVIDDLKRHADVYREISILSGKEPGRDAYPSDIFYTHSRLLEKGCQHEGGGSITILPICETKGGDITDYISTNIISITDGQIVLSKKNFDKGQKPAIDYGLSVSRLGGAVQEKSMKKVGANVKRELLSYLETREIYELANIDDMGAELQNKLLRGQELLNNFNQYKFSPREPEQILATFTSIMGDE